QIERSLPFVCRDASARGDIKNFLEPTPEWQSVPALSESRQPIGIQQGSDKQKGVRRAELERTACQLGRNRHFRSAHKQDVVDFSFIESGRCTDTLDLLECSPRFG